MASRGVRCDSMTFLLQLLSDLSSTTTKHVHVNHLQPGVNQLIVIQHIVVVAVITENHLYRPTSITKRSLQGVYVRGRFENLFAGFWMNNLAWRPYKYNDYNQL